MQPVDPCVELHRVPPGSHARLLIPAPGDEDLVNELPTIRTPNGYTITRWSLSPLERSRIAAGADVFVTLCAGAAPLPPMKLTAGPIDWTE